MAAFGGLRFANPPYGDEFTSSLPRRREGTFTFEVQHFKLFAEYLSRSLKVQAFTRSMVVGGHQTVELALVQGGQVCFTWQPATQATDGVLNATLLPRGMRIAEVGGHI